jgi:hypothetical protein
MANNSQPTPSVGCPGREKKHFGFLDRRHMHREAEEILARFDIHIDVRLPLSRYTTAIPQMVAIARAVSDAATSAGTPLNRLSIPRIDTRGD